MEDKLFGYMQWPEIEAIIYSEHDRPKQILGSHKVEDGVLVQAYFPGAVSCEVLVKDREPMMMKAVDSEYFAQILPDADIPDYMYQVTYGDGHVVKCRDAYAFPATIPEEDIKNSRQESITKSIRCWERIRCVFAGLKGSVLLYGLRMPCVSALSAISISGMDGVIRCSVVKAGFMSFLFQG